jgi:hypothetical protein
VDGVGNGYSRLLDTTRAAEVIGTRADAHVLANFVERWLRSSHGEGVEDNLNRLGVTPVIPIGRVRHVSTRVSDPRP